jgi:hypothetical protein
MHGFENFFMQAILLPIFIILFVSVMLFAKYVAGYEGTWHNLISKACIGLALLIVWGIYLVFWTSQDAWAIWLAVGVTVAFLLLVMAQYLQDEAMTS